MDFNNMFKKPVRRNAPLVERLESRDLPTVIIHHAGLGTSMGRIGTSQKISALVQGGGVQPLPSNQNAGVLGPPTASEIAKQHFTLAMSGGFVTSPGRYVGEPLQGEIVATGGSNQSLRLNAQMQFFNYSEPTAAPTGQIALSPKNVSSTGNLLILDLTSDGTNFSHGLATRYTWTVNPASGGLYANATGSGTLSVRYSVTRVRNGTFVAGKAFIKALGSVVTSHGLTLDTSTAGNRPNPLG